MSRLGNPNRDSLHPASGRVYREPGALSFGGWQVVNL